AVNLVGKLGSGLSICAVSLLDRSRVSASSCSNGCTRSFFRTGFRLRATADQSSSSSGVKDRCCVRGGRPGRLMAHPCPLAVTGQKDEKVCRMLGHSRLTARLAAGSEENVSSLGTSDRRAHVLRDHQPLK